MQNLFDPSWKDESYYRAQWKDFYQFRRRLLKRFFLGIAPFFVVLVLIDTANKAFLDKVPHFIKALLIVLDLSSWILGGYTIFSIIGNCSHGIVPAAENAFFKVAVSAIHSRADVDIADYLVQELNIASNSVQRDIPNHSRSKPKVCCLSYIEQLKVRPII